MRQEHAESQARPAPAPLRGHATGRAVMTSASRDLAVLGEQLAVLGVPSHVTVSSEAAVLMAGRTLSRSRMAGTGGGQGESARDAMSCGTTRSATPRAQPGAWPARSQIGRAHV